MNSQDEQQITVAFERIESLGLRTAWSLEAWGVRQRAAWAPLSITGSRPEKGQKYVKKTQKEKGKLQNMMLPQPHNELFPCSFTFHHRFKHYQKATIPVTYLGDV